MSNVPATSEQSVDPTEALHTCVQLFNTPRTQEIAESTCNTNAQARELQESVGRGQGRLAPLQQVLQHRERQLTSFRSPVDASVQHLLQREVDRVRSELQTRTRESVEAEADRDAALARTLPLESAMQLMQVQMCDLVDQLSGASALAGHVLREAVENEKRLLNADHDCWDLVRRITDLEREKEELHDTVNRLHHDRDLAQRKADLLNFELTSARKSSTASPSDRHARESALRDDADGDQVATGLTPQPLHGSVKQTDMDRAILLQKVYELVGMLDDSNAGWRESELKCQSLASKQVNAELELQKARRQLSSLQKQKEQMQRVHSSKTGDIMTLATRLLEQILELEDSIDANLASGALGVANGGASTSPAVDMRSPRLSQLFQGLHGGVHEVRTQTKAHPEFSKYHSSSQPKGSLSQFEDTRVLSPRVGWGDVGDSFLPEAHSAIPTWNMQAPTRGMLVYLNMQMSEITGMPQFEREFLEEVALAANVHADDLKVFRVEASFDAHHAAPHSSVRPEESHSATNVVVEIHVPKGVTWCEGGLGGRGPTIPGVYVVRSLMEQMHEPQSLLRMGFHSRHIFRIVPVMERLFEPRGEPGSSRSTMQEATSSPQRLWSSHPAAYHPAAASTQNPPIFSPRQTSPRQTSPSLSAGGTESKVIAHVKEELLAEVTKVREWAQDEVAKERRTNLRLQHHLQQHVDLKRQLVQRLEQAQAECRAEQRERMRFTATYVKNVSGHIHELDRIEQEMSSKVLKTEHLLSRISTQTRAVYTSLCALCVRSRLEIEEHQRKAQESLMIANKYRDTLKVLEQDLDSTRAGSIENAAARVQTAQAVARGVQELQAEMREIAQELVHIHRDEAALQSVSEFMEQRLLQSCEDLDIAERELDRSVEEMSVLQGRCNQQTVAMADLHRIMVEGICRASNQRRCRFVRTSAWNLWVSSVRSKVQWRTLTHLAANPRGRLHQARIVASSIMQNWNFMAQQKKHRTRFGTFLWGFALRSFTTRICTRVIRVWLAAHMDGWRFRVCSLAHARLHRRRVWYHCFRRWQKEAGSLPAPLAFIPATGTSSRERDVILDPARKPVTLKWQRLCIKVMLRWVRDRSVESFLWKNERSPPTRVKSPHSRFSALPHGLHSNGPPRPRFLAPPRDLGLISSPSLLTKAGSAAKPKQPASFGQDLQGLRSAAMRFSDSD